MRAEALLRESGGDRGCTGRSFSCGLRPSLSTALRAVICYLSLVASTRSRPKAHLVVVGRPGGTVVEGGGNRVAQLRMRLERLPASITYVEPGAATSGRAFIPYAVRTGLAAKLLRPGWRHFVVSLSYGISPSVLRLLSARCVLLYFDVCDEPGRQYRDLKIATGTHVQQTSMLVYACAQAFQIVGFASPGLMRFFPERGSYTVAPNAADPAHFTADPLPATDTVALVGSTSRGRGADLLISACEVARRDFPELRLRLALHNMGGQGNLDELKREHGGHRWISFESVPYARLPQFLRESTVCVVPHPRTEYTDAALPLKLFDYMAAGRPVVTTDCAATAELVLRHDAGLVCRADPAEMARALGRILADRARASAMGSNGRRAVERIHNWERTLEGPITALSRRLEASSGSRSATSPAE